MNRKEALKTIVSCVAQGDTKTAMRIFVESKISKKAFDEAYLEGLCLKDFLKRRQDEDADLMRNKK